MNFKRLSYLLSIAFLLTLKNLFAYDLNNDGYDDIIFSNYCNDENDNERYDINSFIYWGDSTASYSNKTELPTIAAMGSAVADLNSDGYLDIVFSNRHNNSGYTNINSYIYWGNATASYSTKTELPTVGAYGNTVADLDQNGYLDIVFSNYMEIDGSGDGHNRIINSLIYLGDPINSYTSITELPTEGATGLTAGNISAYGQNYPVYILFLNLQQSFYWF